MKRKNLLVIMLLGALGLAAGGGYIATRDANVAKPVSAGSTYDVTNDDFTTYFNRGAVYAADTLNITEDIDLNGATQASAGIAGTFTGTINGNGHTISNFVLPTGQAFLLWQVGSAGSVNNLTITGTTASGANSLGFLANQMDGTVTNCTFNITTAGAVNTLGVTWGADSGTWTNCRANWTVPTSSNTLYRIGKESGATYNNCTYTITTGEGQSAAFEPAVDGKVTLATNVSAVTVNDVEAIVNGTVTENLTLTGNEFDHVKWTVGDTSIATVADASTTTSSVVVNGVSAGTTTLTAQVYADAGETTPLASDEGNITVVTSSPVTAISVTPATASIVEGKTTNLSGALTGTTYDHITWSSSATDVATVAGNVTSATVTAVSAGNATITAKVYSAVTESADTLLATDTSTITVTAATKVDFYFYVQKSFNWTTESMVFYGGTVSGDQTVAMTKQDYTFKFADTSSTGSPIVEWDLYHCQANYTALNIGSSPTGVNFQAGNGQNPGRWGNGYSLQDKDQTKAIAICLPSVSSGDLWNRDSTAYGETTKAALTALDSVTSSDWRVSNSICWMLTDNKTKYDAKMATYNGLSANEKTIFGSAVDGDCTMAETFTMLAAHPYQGSGSAFFDSNEDGNSSLVMLYTVLGIVLLGTAGGIAYVIKRKRA